MKVFSKTDIGLKRSENQDRVWASLLESEDKADIAAAVVLCDGMGGENAGSFASETTVNFISERIKRGFRPDLSRNSIRNLLITSVTAANNLVYDLAEFDHDMEGMGTTCISVIVHSERAYIINVGDSRVYHAFGDGKSAPHSIQQVTKDHSYINKLIEDGEITEEESKTHPKRNCLTRAVGAESILTPDYYELDLQPDSILMLCSDGLHAYGEDVDIAEIMINNPVGKICDKLVEYALSNGGRDNITIAVISVK
ncbi:MAG: Stp1/IreP family PP2C-type Ser/Thr phosphatase [Oscillospiraceae bacterium]|jgi:protein phosphatase|nr:Stp1/IreP family PP2C-type Ser/Thr phosphatase [Oscillospiraceae bacterium]